AVRRERNSERLRLKPQFDLCNCRQGLWARSQRVLRADRRRFLTYDSRMSESMRLANDVKLTAWISFTLHCMSLLIAQSGHSSAHSFRTRLQAVASPADDRLPCRLSRNPWPSPPS